MKRRPLNTQLVAVLLGVASCAGIGQRAAAADDPAHQIIGVWGMATNDNAAADPFCKRRAFEFKGGNVFVYHDKEAGTTKEGKYAIAGDKLVLTGDKHRTETSLLHFEGGIIRLASEDGKHSATLSRCPSPQ